MNGLEKLKTRLAEIRQERIKKRQWNGQFYYPDILSIIKEIEEKTEEKTGNGQENSF